MPEAGASDVSDVQVLASSHFLGANKAVPCALSAMRKSVTAGTLTIDGVLVGIVSSGRHHDEAKVQGSHHCPWRRIRAILAQEY